MTGPCFDEDVRHLGDHTPTPSQHADKPQASLCLLPQWCAGHNVE